MSPMCCLAILPAQHLMLPCIVVEMVNLGHAFKRLYAAWPWLLVQPALYKEVCPMRVQPVLC